MTNIVGVMGLARSGKDTFATELVAAGYTRLAFADPVKDMLLALDPLLSVWHPPCECCHSDETYLSGALEEYGGWEGLKRSTYGPGVRALLQRMGTEAGRGVLGDDVWVNALSRRLWPFPGERVVIPDVRFPNEADYVKSTGGTLVRLIRPGQVAMPHESEQLSYPADFTYYCGSPDEVRHAAIALLDTLD